MATTLRSEITISSAPSTSVNNTKKAKVTDVSDDTTVRLESALREGGCIIHEIAFTVSHSATE